VPDSEGEEDGRGKSPFERVVDLGKQALSQATFYVQQRQLSMPRDPEEPSIEQTPAVNGNGNESSYDYADEEETYQATQNKRHSVAHRRGRISVDNKAYKPPLSESESELSDGGNTRRKKKKKGPTGGPLSTLPVLSADKAKKKKKKTHRKNLEAQEEESESEENSQQMDVVCTSISVMKPTSKHFFSNHYNECQYPEIRILLSPKSQLPACLRNPVTTMMSPWKAPSKVCILYQK
jgi:SUN domain-containing protein 1/2